MATPRERTKKASRYQAHPMLAREAKTIAALERETGRSWDGWLALAKRKGLETQPALRAWLMEEHGLPRMRAAWLASVALSTAGFNHENPVALVDALYGGRQAGLRPLHEKVVDAMLALGPDVVVTACQTMVPVYRKHVFAEIRPADGAVEVQLALGDVAASGKLERAERSPGDRVTHRILVRAPGDVDAHLKKWLPAAYDRGAGTIRRATRVTVPADVSKALRGSAKASATWETCTPAMRRDLVEWITSAKQAETRTRRTEAAVARLAAGHRRMY